MRREEVQLRREDEPTRPVRVTRIRAVRRPPSAICSEADPAEDPTDAKAEVGSRKSEVGMAIRW